MVAWLHDHLYVSYLPIVNYAILFNFRRKGFVFFLDINYLYICAGMYILSGAFSFINGKKFMMFVHAATQVFITLDLQNPDEVNLPKLTKRKPGDPGVFGVMYFNY